MKAQEVDAEAVKRADAEEFVRRDHDAAGTLLFAGHEFADAVPHLAGRFVRKRQGEDIPGRHPLLKQVCDPASNDPRFSAPRPGDNQQRSLQMRDRLSLGRRQIGGRTVVS